MEAGYAGKILRVDLSSRSITSHPTKDYAERFLGGLGVAAKVCWDEVQPETKAFDPENCLLFVTGPLAGFKGLPGSRWQICGKSPTTKPEHFSYSNLGGRWGAHLKFSGHDALIVQGKSEKPIYLYIEDSKVEIRDGSHIWGKGAVTVREILKRELGDSASVVACGPAGENMVVFASTTADNDSSGSGGFGAVMGSKKLKAIAIKGSGKITAAKPERLEELKRYFLTLTKGRPTIHVEHPKIKRSFCYGCTRGCIRAVYKAGDGTKGKAMCQAAIFYQRRDPEEYALLGAKAGSLKEWDEVPFFANRLCDEYGLDTFATEIIYIWLIRCYRAGILTEKGTGIPFSKVGGLEFIESLTKKIAYRDGFGDLLASGILAAAEAVGNGAHDFISDDFAVGQSHSTYCPRMYITTGLFYAMEPRPHMQQLHEIFFAVMTWLLWVNKVEGAFLSSNVFRAFAKTSWGSEVAADFSTYEGKALAAKKIQDRQYSRECLILCDMLQPIFYLPNTEGYKGDLTVDSKFLSAIIGKQIDEAELYAIGERIFNLQRAISIREGHKGRDDDILPHCFYTIPLERAYNNHECLVPGKDGEVISKKGTVVDEAAFESMKDEYYQLRGWDISTGLQPKSKLKEIGLLDIVSDLDQRGLAV